MAKDVKHFQYEFRNCMYQLTDEELVYLLRQYTVEAERLRVVLKAIEPDEDNYEIE